MHRKINWEKAQDISVEILDIFHQTVPKQHLFKNINGHSKKQHKMYGLSHKSMNYNLETKNDKQIKTKKTICRSSDHVQQEPRILFNKKVYSLMCWEILLDIYISKQMNNKTKWYKETSRITSELKLDSHIYLFSNNQLVLYTKRINQVLHLSTHVGSKINQI